MEELHLPTIPCCVCGSMITPNNANMCVQCIQAEVDITEGIQRRGMLTQCPKCSKWHVRQDNWMFYETESPELLAVILKKITGLSKYRLIDAKFLWTEPHSRRIKVRLVVQGEVLDKIQIQQQVDVEFAVQHRQCMSCIKQATPHTWKSAVQIRQRVNTKRTLYFLEQVIIANGMQREIIDLETVNDGMDVYFAEKSHAQHFVQFLTSMFPAKITNSKKYISADIKSNIHNFQYTIFVELVPLARNDLVVVPKSIAPGRRSTLYVVSKVSSMVHLLDPITLDEFELSSNKFWRQPFNPLMVAQQLVKFIVLDIEIIGQQGGADVAKQHGGLLAEAEIVKESDFGVNDRTYRVVTHLGHLLHAGDSVFGYDIASATFDESALETLAFEPPDVVLIKKAFPERTKPKKKKLRSLQTRVRRQNKGLEEQTTATEATEAEDPEYREFAELYNSDTENPHGTAGGDSGLAPIDEEEVPTANFEQMNLSTNDDAPATSTAEDSQLASNNEELN